LKDEKNWTGMKLKKKAQILYIIPNKTTSNETNKDQIWRKNKWKDTLRFLKARH
jgi:hypothetical protein